MHGLVHILVSVDNLIVAGKSHDGVQAVKNSVSATFDVRDMGEVKDFIGMKVMRDQVAKVLTLSHPGHVIVLLEASRMSNSTPDKTKMVSVAKLARTGGHLLPDGNRYAELVGSLLYLSTTTRPVIAFAVGVLSRYMACPEEAHMRAAKGVLRYRRGATFLGVAYGAYKPLQGYVYTDWAGDVDARRSTTGFIFTLNGGPVLRGSKRESTVTTSTDEDEYVGAAVATKETLSFRMLSSDPGVDCGAFPMGEDNQACLALVKISEATGRTKHVDVAYHMVREYVARCAVTVYFLPSAEMPTDELTKALPGPAFKAFRDAAGVALDMGVAAGAREPDPAC